MNTLSKKELRHKDIIDCCKILGFRPRSDDMGRYIIYDGDNVVIADTGHMTLTHLKAQVKAKEQEPIGKAVNLKIERANNLSSRLNLAKRRISNFLDSCGYVLDENLCLEPDEKLAIENIASELQGDGLQVYPVFTPGLVAINGSAAYTKLDGHTCVITSRVEVYDIVPGAKCNVPDIELIRPADVWKALRELPKIEKQLAEVHTALAKAKHLTSNI